jgi:integrase
LPASFRSFTFSGKKVTDYNVTAFDPTRHVKSWRTAWRTLTKKAGLPGFRLHDLRRFAITQLAESGTSDATIMAIAGQVSRRMPERYSPVRMEAKPHKPRTNAVVASTRPVQVIERIGGPANLRGFEVAK